MVYCLKLNCKISAYFYFHMVNICVQLWFFKSLCECNHLNQNHCH